MLRGLSATMPARELMEKMGYTKIYNVHNGISRWFGEANPVVRN